MREEMTYEEKLDYIQNEIYTIDNIQSILEGWMKFNEGGLEIYEKLLTLLELQKEHINKITDLF
ncbi:hypothetical protein DBY21_05185 [Candidatus Gastranaerophilales bacterium]|nr:MAG: hypothetical protein DBY21_05185 [Candidatus Gastranaerophilales bacterium]